MANALTFPLALGEFFDGLDASALGFDLTESMRHSQTQGGEVLVSDLGPRLWTFEVQVVTKTHAEARKGEALARMLRQAGRPFFAYDKTAAYPAADPGGVLLGAATPTIHTLGSDNRRMRVQGLPAGYVLSRGDPLSFAYGLDPTRYAFHEVITPVTADGSGLTPLFEVSPFIRPGAQVGAAVTFLKPFCKAVMIPGSYRPGLRRPVVTEGFSFSAIQTLR
ncbi:hypothetical protein [Pseudooceanicola nanhaiensis]|uniref:hypothetical protein n=1 Tax=Pseudooceanicola nanhaiensis TaxID=375761 RepID=UPI003515902C